MFTIHCLGFERQQQESIIAVLELAGFGLNNAWSFVDYINSDVMMINIDNEEGRQIYSEYKINHRARIILVSEEKQEADNDQWFLRKKRLNPPSLREFVKLLNQIEVSFVEAEENSSLDKSRERTKNNIINQIQPSLEELAFSEINLDFHHEWLSMLDKEKW